MLESLSLFGSKKIDFKTKDFLKSTAELTMDNLSKMNEPPKSNRVQVPSTSPLTTSNNQALLKISSNSLEIPTNDKPVQIPNRKKDNYLDFENGAAQMKLVRFSNSAACGSSSCKNFDYREHFHCVDCDFQVIVKKEEMIRHLKWHKKRDESLQLGFLRFSSRDDCSEIFPHCGYNRKQTHYHCQMHKEGCYKCYISTSDVQMHANYHKKASAIAQEGFQRYRAVENCGSINCPFSGQSSTHFHCRRSGCDFTFKNKSDMEKHKMYHVKDEQLNKDGFKKFMKHEHCSYENCRFSRICNHIHCIRPGCNYILHSSGQLLSHKRKHDRKEKEISYRNFKLSHRENNRVVSNDKMRDETHSKPVPSVETDSEPDLRIGGIKNSIIPNTFNEPAPFNVTTSQRKRHFEQNNISLFKNSFQRCKIPKLRHATNGVDLFSSRLTNIDNIATPSANNLCTARNNVQVPQTTFNKIDILAFNLKQIELLKHNSIFAPLYPFNSMKIANSVLHSEVMRSLSNVSQILQQKKDNLKDAAKSRPNNNVDYPKTLPTPFCPISSPLTSVNGEPLTIISANRLEREKSVIEKKEGHGGKITNELRIDGVPEGYIRYRFNENCLHSLCNYCQHQTHFHCTRKDCGYGFCDKTRFVQHTARHERLDKLMGGEFQQFRAHAQCGRPECDKAGAVSSKGLHFHCLKCEFTCRDTNKLLAHRRQHQKSDVISAAGFGKCSDGACFKSQMPHQIHYHCNTCQNPVSGFAQMIAHRDRHCR